MKKIKIDNVESITHLDGVKITGISNRREHIEMAAKEVLKNKSVYNALKRLADE